MQLPAASNQHGTPGGGAMLVFWMSGGRTWDSGARDSPVMTGLPALICRADGDGPRWAGQDATFRPGHYSNRASLLNSDGQRLLNSGAQQPSNDLAPVCPATPRMIMWLVDEDTAPLTITRH